MNNITKITYYALVSSLFLAQTVLAEEAGLADKVQTCGKISQSQTRLSCFDSLINEMNSVSNIVNKQKDLSLHEQQVDAFAKEQVKKTSEDKANEINSITLTISKLSKTLRGQWKITFKNGQQWLQKDTIKMKLELAEQVTLTKGALTSVFLQQANGNKRIKVKRLK